MRFAPSVLLAVCLLAHPASAADIPPRDPGLPDPILTPGATNPDVTQANIKSTICKPNWTKTVRPSNGYFRDLKIHQLEEYGLADKALGHYEEDHLISLQLGGHPRNPKNLWPQPYNVKWGARIKDVIESELKRRVCKGEITLPAAQAAISEDWRVPYCRYVRNPKPGLCEKGNPI
jgi:hypothetical protein